MGRAGLRTQWRCPQHSGVGLNHSAPKMAWDTLDSSTVSAVLKHSAPTAF